MIDPLIASLTLEQADALGQAEGAVAAGHFDAAIERLDTLNRSHPHPLLARRLLDLRIAGFASLGAPPVAWSPHQDGRFDAHSGLPEIDAGDLDAEALRAGILGRGGLVVRGLMDPGRAAVAAEGIQRALVARMRLARDAAEPGDTDWFHRPSCVAGGPVQFDRLGAEQYTDSGSLWAVDSPPNACEMLGFYRAVGLREILGAYFGEPAVLSVRKWVLRCMPPNNGGVSGWHQDGRFIGDDIRTVNLWLALSDCGEGADAPGIEFVDGTGREIHETGTRGAVFDWTVGQDLVDEISPGKPVLRPRFAPGDAVLFDHYNLHRTAFGSDQGSRRYAVESWFFAGSKAPARQQPLIFLTPMARRDG